MVDFIRVAILARRRVAAKASCDGLSGAATIDPRDSGSAPLRALDAHRASGAAVRKRRQTATSPPSASAKKRWAAVLAVAISVIHIYAAS
jgi:hypothetical protein